MTIKRTHTATVNHCVFEGKTHGETVEVSEERARKYESIGYLRDVKKKTATNRKTQPKKKEQAAETKEPTNDNQ